VIIQLRKPFIPNRRGSHDSHQRVHHLLLFSRSHFKNR